MLIFFFNDTATTEIYTLSLHDALPISGCTGWGVPRAGYPTRGPVVRSRAARRRARPPSRRGRPDGRRRGSGSRSEEHTSELQSRQYLVCRLLLEKKKTDHVFVSTSHDQ